MLQNFSVLVIEDHPLIVDCYRRAFDQIKLSREDTNFQISHAGDCHSAYEAIKIAAKNGGIDIVCLDISLPPTHDGKISSGEDLGVKIVELMPDTKIIVFTSHNNHYRIRNIMKNVNPDGFLVKCDVAFNELSKAIDKVIYNPPYYSLTVLKSIRKQISNADILDDIDRSILYELSIGTRMKDLPTVIPMCLNGIEKRKYNLRVIFDVIDKTDKHLLTVARERGFI